MGHALQWLVAGDAGGFIIRQFRLYPTSLTALKQPRLRALLESSIVGDMRDECPGQHASEHIEDSL